MPADPVLVIALAAAVANLVVMAALIVPRLLGRPGPLGSARRPLLPERERNAAENAARAGSPSESADGVPPEGALGVLLQYSVDGDPERGGVARAGQRRV